VVAKVKQTVVHSKWLPAADDSSDIGNLMWKYLNIRIPLNLPGHISPVLGKIALNEPPSDGGI
jgi:hypothetical protein